MGRSNRIRKGRPRKREEGEKGGKWDLRHVLLKSPSSFCEIYYQKVKCKNISRLSRM